MEGYSNIYPTRCNVTQFIYIWKLLYMFYFHTMKMEQTECSETSAYNIQTPGNYPEESIKHGVQMLKLLHSSLTSFIKTCFMQTTFALSSGNKTCACISVADIVDLCVT